MLHEINNAHIADSFVFANNYTLLLKVYRYTFRRRDHILKLANVCAF